jgi:hypothetical protein
VRSAGVRGVVGRKTVVHVNCLHETEDSHHQHEEHGAPAKETPAIELAYGFHNDAMKQMDPAQYDIEGPNPQNGNEKIM